MQTSKTHINKYKLQDPYLEKHLQAKIGRWLKDGNMFAHVAEVKLVTGGTLNFNKFEDQQLPSLERAYGEGLYYKLTDASIGCKPFDYMCCQKVDSYVVCQFWKKRQQEICYFMHIEDVMKIKDSGTKALKEEDFIKYGWSINLANYK